MGEFDQSRLRPATVEELAAAERAEAASSGKDGGKRPLVIAVATGVLLISGAGAFAMASKTEPKPAFAPPLGAAAPFGVGYVDGFGEHVPKPSRTAAASPRRLKPKPAPSIPPTIGLLVDVPTPSATESNQEGVAVTTSLSAVYWTMAWGDTYDVFVWVHNDGPAAAAWQVSVALPEGATVATTWAAKRSLSNGVWVFSSPQGTTLGAGRTYLFAFEGKRGSGSFALRSCSVNGVACGLYA